jgi:hypothetical protein
MVLLVAFAIIATGFATLVTRAPLSEVVGNSDDLQADFVTPWYHGTAWMPTSRMAFLGRNSHETRPLD